jgi:hypothetical protein
MTGATLNSKTPNGPGSEGKLLSDLQAKYPEADNRLRDFNASLANLAPTNIIKLGVASTLALQASVGEKDIVFRFIRDVHQIDAAAIIRSHLAVFRILNLVGAGHLILPAALTETPTEIKVKDRTIDHFFVSS